jgi:uncharacterized protein YcfL
MKKILICTIMIMTLVNCSSKTKITRDYEKSPCACNERTEIMNFKS